MVTLQMSRSSGRRKMRLYIFSVDFGDGEFFFFFNKLSFLEAAAAAQWDESKSVSCCCPESLLCSTLLPCSNISTYELRKKRCVPEQGHAAKRHRSHVLE